MADRTILDEAEQDLLVDAFDEVVEEARRHVAAVVLRVAADRLRAEADRLAPTVWPHGSTFGVEVDVWRHAADLLTAGTDR